MKTVFLFLLLFFGVSLQSCSTNNEPVKPNNQEEEIKDENEGQDDEKEQPDKDDSSDEEEPSKQWNLVFTEDFNEFDNSVWTKEAHGAGWVNNELQKYTEESVSIGMDGDKTVLILTAKREGNKFYSGRINSKGKKSFQYGKVEASIKLPKTADGLWPAFWMMGDNDKEWPACGEIDIMEMGEKEGIETNKHNFTRFLVISNPWLADELKDRSKVNKANIVFSLPHSEGSLSQVLSIFSFYKINLTKIQSLPIIGREWEYLFYVDIMFNDYLRYKQAIDAVTPLTKALKILGEYAEGESTL